MHTLLETIILQARTGDVIGAARSWFYLSSPDGQQPYEFTIEVNGREYVVTLTLGQCKADAATVRNLFKKGDLPDGKNGS